MPLAELLAYLPDELLRFVVRGCLLELRLHALAGTPLPEHQVVDLVVPPELAGARKLTRVVPGSRRRVGS